VILTHNGRNLAKNLKWSTAWRNGRSAFFAAFRIDSVHLHKSGRFFRLKTLSRMPFLLFPASRVGTARPPSPNCGGAWRPVSVIRRRDGDRAMEAPRRTRTRHLYAGHNGVHILSLPLPLPPTRFDNDRGPPQGGQAGKADKVGARERMSRPPMKSAWIFSGGFSCAPH
jgi:hypothetical protein